MDLSIAGEVITGFAPVFVVMILGYLIHWLPSNWKMWYRNTFISLPIPVQLGITVVALLVLYQVISADAQPFIYFQF
ncbi:MAG: hypothetical protein NWQ53_10595 [Flavobacteriales bacterium]|nr:hypothetical protein [Flavobacteriales bacterium]